MAIIHVTGDPRAGKTSYVVARNLTENMTYFNWRYRAACNHIKWRNKITGRTKALPPQRHVIFSNILIWRRYPNMSIYPMSGWEFGVPTDVCLQVKALVPYGVYIFDEAQEYFDSKGDKELPPWVTRAFERHGHIFLEIFLITQRPTRLNKDIRAIAREHIHIESSEHTYLVGKHKIKSDKFLDYGKLIKTVWHGRQFKTAGEHETYVDGKSKEDKSLGKPFKYVFHGDIRSHYNPTAYATEMEDLSKDYNYYDYTATDRPEAWDNWKKKVKKDDGQRDRQRQSEDAA